MSIETDLMRDEGLRQKPYRDTVGKLTIGYGRNLDDVGISESEAFILLRNDIQTARTDLDHALPWWKGFPEPSQRGLINMCFNLGLPRLLGFKRMLKALEASNGALAAMECLDSKWSRQVGERARRIATLYRND